MIHGENTFVFFINTVNRGKMWKEEKKSFFSLMLKYRDVVLLLPGVDFFPFSSHLFLNEEKKSFVGLQVLIGNT